MGVQNLKQFELDFEHQLISRRVTSRSWAKRCPDGNESV